jgi:hypothetical protein
MSVKWTERSLDKVGVNIRSDSAHILGCQECGQGWAVNLLPGGHLPRGWWRCPNGCNEDLDARTGRARHGKA